MELLYSVLGLLLILCVVAIVVRMIPALIGAAVLAVLTFLALSFVWVCVNDFIGADDGVAVQLILGVSACVGVIGFLTSAISPEYWDIFTTSSNSPPSSSSPSGSPDDELTSNNPESNNPESNNYSRPEGYQHE